MSHTSDSTAVRRPVPAGTFRLTTVRGVDLTVSNSWFLIIGLIAVVVGPQIQEVQPELGSLAYLAGVGFAILLYLSVLLHEISHAVAARSFDMQVNSINLHFLGGATEIDGEAASPWREFVIAVVGPLTSLAIGAAAYLSRNAFEPGMWQLAVVSLATVNLVVGILNLVPGLPLDGGRVLQSAVWAITNRRSLGVVIAAWGGRLAAVLALGYPLVAIARGGSPTITDYLFAFMVGSFLWTGATQSLRVAEFRRKLPRLRARQLARPAIGVPSGIPLSEGIRRAQEAHAGSLVVVAGDGRPLAIVNEAAVASTPLERRPWVSVGDLARRLEDGLMLPADIEGESLIRAMQRTPATEYVLLETTGSIFGVLVATDVDAAFRAPEPGPARG